MGPRRDRHVAKVIVPAMLIVAMVFAAVAISGCGKDPGEQALESILEQAMEEQASADTGEDVDIDLDLGNDDGTITITGDDGEQVIQAGDGTTLPEGFPSGLIPDGVNVVQSITAEQTGVPMMIVSFESATPTPDMYDHYVGTLQGAGFTILNKTLVQSETEDDVMVIQGQNAGTVVTITGGGREGDAYVYVVQVQADTR